MRKRLICTLLVLCLALSLAAPAAAAYVDGQYVSGQGLFVMDFETGLELYSYNADLAYVPASMTKLMSMYLTYEAIANGEITKDTVVPISSRVYSLSRNYGYQNTVPLYYNQTYTVDELMNLILVYSASASVVAMAELISGTEANFVARMNAKAAEWGLNAKFNGCSGVEDNYISPRSVAVLARNLMMDYPEVLNITSQSSVYFHGRYYNSTNHLLNSQPYWGADGLKTGTTTNSGACFVGTARRDGVRIITVTMHSSSGNERFNDTIKLLDYGFSVRDSMVKDYLESLREKLEPYTDVYMDDWFAGSVAEINARGLMKGTSDTTFSPNDQLSRAMTVTILHRLAGLPEAEEGEEMSFPDVPEDAWYSPALSWAASLGIVKGREDGSFGPNDPVSRQELAVMLYSYATQFSAGLDELPKLEDFSDQDQIAVWARDAMAWAVEAGLFLGSGGKLDPTASATRAETASLMIRFDDYMSSEDPDKPSPDEPVESDSPDDPGKPVESDAPDDPGAPSETDAPDDPGSPVEPDAPETPAPEPSAPVGAEPDPSEGGEGQSDVPEEPGQAA